MAFSFNGIRDVHCHLLFQKYIYLITVSGGSNGFHKVVGFAGFLSFDLMHHHIQCPLHMGTVCVKMKSWWARQLQMSSARSLGNIMIELFLTPVLLHFLVGIRFF